MLSWLLLADATPADTTALNSGLESLTGLFNLSLGLVMAMVGAWAGVRIFRHLVRHEDSDWPELTEGQEWEEFYLDREVDRLTDEQIHEDFGADE